MARQTINPETVCRPVSPTYSHAAVAGTGRMLFIAGQVATDGGGRCVDGGIEEQTAQVYENIRLILEAAGASLDDVLHTDVFMLSIERDLEGYLRVRRAVFPTNPPPSTLVQVNALVSPEYLVEVKAVAELPSE